MPIYQFQCMRCFIVSGYMSANLHDAPTCCDGELMVAIKLPRRRERPRSKARRSPGYSSDGANQGRKDNDYLHQIN